MIEPCCEEDYDEVERVWWDSVQATHQFIAPEYLQGILRNLKGLYLPNVSLYAWRDEGGRILGFVGWSSEMVEMLFVDPEQSGKGIGSRLLKFAIDKGLKRVDVNEANEAALRFYQKHGFKVIGRSEVDSQGEPYPILHLQSE